MTADEVVAAGQGSQVVVPAGTWQAAEVAPGGAWTLAGCDVAPGFVFADFRLGDRAALLAGFPAARDLVLRLTRLASKP